MCCASRPGWGRQTLKAMVVIVFSSPHRLLFQLNIKIHLYNYVNTMSRIRKNAYIKEPVATAKPVKYLNLMTQDNMTKQKAKVLSGYSEKTNPVDIENTLTYQNAKLEMADSLLPLHRIAIELNKNIVQDTDKGAKNMAIKIAIGVKGVLEDSSEESGSVSVVFKNNV